MLPVISLYTSVGCKVRNEQNGERCAAKEIENLIYKVYIKHSFNDFINRVIA